jgi:hypothetical protein
MTTEFEAMIADRSPLIGKVWRHCEEQGRGPGP